ncbi:MAG TPA: DUF4126 domain-containing protein [Thermoanaerobaculia bacterium]|nr:DUF4126 domain-containing protein [Thermoanaerobaculia bacterium]
MEVLLSICLGFGLSAACGFRIFVPFLIMSIASRAGHLDLAASFDWLASDAAIVTFAVAAVLEIGAYFVPWVDNLLDSAATPTAVVAGVLASAATIDGTSPLVGWTLAVIGGGGLAGLIQGGTTLLRGASSLMTAGFGNPIVSSAEAGGAVTLASLAILVPVVAAMFALTVVLAVATRTARAMGRRPAAALAASAEPPC